jgi:hypothetical protein
VTPRQPHINYPKREKLCTKKLLFPSNLDNMPMPAKSTFDDKPRVENGRDKR